MNSDEIRHILNIIIPSKFDTGVYASDQLENLRSDNIAIIFNSDESYKPGTHWLGLFKNEREKTIEFFDSYGMNINFYSSYLEKFMLKNYKISRVNKFQLQSNFSEVCGQYCLYFLFNRVNNITYDEIISKFDNNLINNDLIVESFVNDNFNPTLLSNKFYQNYCKNNTKCYQFCKIKNYE